MESIVHQHIAELEGTYHFVPAGVITFVMVETIARPTEMHLERHLRTVDAQRPWRPDSNVILHGEAVVGDDLPSIARISAMRVQEFGKLKWRTCSFTIMPLGTVKSTQIKAYVVYLRDLAARLADYGIDGVASVMCQVELVGGVAVHSSLGVADIETDEFELVEAGPADAIDLIVPDLDSTPANTVSLEDEDTQTLQLVG